MAGCGGGSSGSDGSAYRRHRSAAHLCAVAALQAPCRSCRPPACHLQCCCAAAAKPLTSASRGWVCGCSGRHPAEGRLAWRGTQPTSPGGGCYPGAPCPSQSQVDPLRGRPGACWCVASRAGLEVCAVRAFQQREQRVQETCFAAAYRRGALQLYLRRCDIFGAPRRGAAAQI